MAIILGSMTTVNVDGKSDGFQSVSWDTQVQNNKLWSIGKWTPWTTQVSVTETVNLTTYAGVLNMLTLTPSNSCANSGATKQVIIDPQVCSSAVDGMS